jgi:hypothetical protein
METKHESIYRMYEVLQRTVKEERSLIGNRKYKRQRNRHQHPTHTHTILFQVRNKV